VKEKKYRSIFYYKNYYLDFFNTIDYEVQKKFNWTLKLIATVDRVPVKYFKHIKDSSGLFKIRIEFESNTYRVFSFFDKEQLVILINAYQKKSKKTSKKEIEKAEKLKKQYFDEKDNK